MWMNYKKYRYHHLVENLSAIAKNDIEEFLKFKTQKDMAPLEWFESKYGSQVPEKVRDVMKLWWTVPCIRAREYTEWAPLTPNLSEAAFNLPGVVNFSLNCISPGGAVPEHSDYSYDMREDLSGTKRAYVILVAVNIPSDKIDECGFSLGGENYYIKTGDIRAFDGSIPHSAWNKTQNWRYTLNIDIEGSYWNV
jgi:hypothetical protein